MRMGFVTFFKECSPISSNGKSLGTRATDSSLMRSTQLRLYSGSRWHYGASGSVVNVAARLRELAREGSILISAVSLEKISKDFVVEDMGNHSLKNIKNTVHVYRLMDELRV